MAHPHSQRINTILYESVRLSRQRTSTSFIRTIETSTTKAPGFFAMHVKSLSVVFAIRVDDITRIISRCRGIENLTTWFLMSECGGVGGAGNTNNNNPFLSMRPKKLSAWHGVLCSPNPQFGLPFFSRVTHLTIVNIWEDWTTWPWPEYALPSLTHLSLDLASGSRALTDSEDVSGTLGAILARCARLRICALRVNNHISEPGVRALLRGLGLSDPRIVFFTTRDPFQIREAHSDEEANMWAALEAAAVGQRAYGHP
jgi:hypothetical protein